MGVYRIGKSGVRNVMSRKQMGIFQCECMILAATPPQNVGCEKCLLNGQNVLRTTGGIDQ